MTSNTLRALQKPIGCVGGKSFVELPLGPDGGYNVIIHSLTNQPGLRDELGLCPRCVFCVYAHHKIIHIYSDTYDERILTNQSQLNDP